MRRTESNREALAIYQIIKTLLDESGADCLHISDCLTVKRAGTVTSAIWRPNGCSTTGLCVVDGGDDNPFPVSFVRGGWTHLLKRYAGARSDC